MCISKVTFKKAGDWLILAYTGLSGATEQSSFIILKCIVRLIAIAAGYSLPPFAALLEQQSCRQAKILKTYHSSPSLWSYVGIFPAYNRSIFQSERRADPFGITRCTFFKILKCTPEC